MHTHENHTIIQYLKSQDPSTPPPCIIHSSPHIYHLFNDISFYNAHLIMNSYIFYAIKHPLVIPMEREMPNHFIISIFGLKFHLYYQSPLDDHYIFLKGGPQLLIFINNILLF